MKLYVSNLPLDTTSEDVRKLFREFGEIESAEVVFDYETKISRGFAIVKMASEEEGGNAIDGLDGHRYRGMLLDVIESKRPVKHYRANWGIQFESPSYYFHNNNR